MQLLNMCKEIVKYRVYINELGILENIVRHTI